MEAEKFLGTGIYLESCSMVCVVKGLDASTLIVMCGLELMNMCLLHDFLWNNAHMVVLLLDAFHNGTNRLRPGQPASGTDFHVNENVNSAMF